MLIQTCLAIEQVRNDCPYTCGECVCKDIPEGWGNANNATCKRYPQMKDNCPLSCGLCGLEEEKEEEVEDKEKEKEEEVVVEEGLNL